MKGLAGCVLVAFSVSVLMWNHVAHGQLASTADDKAQPGEILDRLYFVPSGLLFQPLIANVCEGRIGLVKDLGTSDIRLDIGNSIDVMGFVVESTEDRDKRLSLGADFIAYALLYSKSERIILQVDAVDAIIGGHLSYSSSRERGRQVFSARLRICHLSSHFVDGHYSSATQQWRDGIEPRPYGREFVDAVAAYAIDCLRVYGGMNYAFRVRPSLPRLACQAGVELVSQPLAGGHVTFYVAHDFKLAKVEEYSGINTTQAGVRLGDWKGQGVDLFLTYFNGTSIHGEYYDQRTSYFGAGFLIAFH